MTTDASHRPDPARTAVITPTGEFDMVSLVPLEAEIERALTQHDSIVLDASGITFGDSMFIRLVMTTHHRTDLRIAAPSPVVTRLFGLIGADSVLRIYPTLEDALNA
ncbi:MULTISPECIES: STAS domain-containing protein [unclassified Streptomyces]|uniref:STAS domain-containing protein n=1 Tax=unclassified Streptomyces TaxID=2593676 RepID=UPI0018E97E09|nr:STAS domain-containing protein [Streptomyces sp. CB02058]